jgi:hypothetical protein
VAGAGGGIGGAVATLRFRADDALEAKLEAGALQSVLASSGAVGAKAWRTDLAATFPDGPPREVFPELAVIVEGVSPGAAAAGAEALLGALRETAPPVHRGLYRLLHALPA